jgi:hypothetical protein
MYEAVLLAGNRAEGVRVMHMAESIARATGLGDLFAQQVPALPPTGDTPPAVPLGTDTVRR